MTSRLSRGKKSGLAEISCEFRKFLSGLSNSLMPHTRIKFFAHPDLDEFRKLELDQWFGKVVVEKPKESRSGK